MMHPLAVRGRAFTFIEVILAVTLSVLLIGTALWFYQYAGQVRSEVSLQASDIAQRRQMLDRITMDLRNAVALPGQTGALTGTTDRVTFITAGLPGKSVWTEQKLTETPPTPEQDLRKVSYGLSIYEDDFGERFVVGIDSQVQKLLSVPVVEEGQQLKTTMLSTRYLFMRFQYWDGTAWQPEWQEKPTPPLAIELVIGEQEMEEGGDPLQYPHDTIRRVIYLPSGAPSVTEGSVIQGLNAP
jgi:hypothetical protein